MPVMSKAIIGVCTKEGNPARGILGRIAQWIWEKGQNMEEPIRYARTQAPCNSCSMARVNGVPVHETGCINARRSLCEDGVWRHYSIVEASEFIDVRLQVTEDGDAIVRFGSSDYDQDHSGFWGAGSVSYRMSKRDAMREARSLFEQAIEAWFTQE